MYLNDIILSLRFILYLIIHRPGSLPGISNAGLFVRLISVFLCPPIISSNQTLIKGRFKTFRLFHYFLDIILTWYLVAKYEGIVERPFSMAVVRYGRCTKKGRSTRNAVVRKRPLYRGRCPKNAVVRKRPFYDTPKTRLVSLF
jgi:hypothetical protein